MLNISFTHLIDSVKQLKVKYCKIRVFESVSQEWPGLSFPNMHGLMNVFFSIAY